MPADTAEELAASIAARVTARVAAGMTAGMDFAEMTAGLVAESAGKPSDSNATVVN